MTDKLCMHCYVTGKVQGVCYRANAQKEAQRLGVTGYARNLSDGRVEVMACGSRESLALLYQWLQRGPERAKVTGVTRENLPWQAQSHFTIS